MSAILTLPIRLFALILGGFFVIQGVTTAGFLGILGLFGGSLSHMLHLLALVVFSLGLIAVGVWLLYAGVRNFPYLRTYIRSHWTDRSSAST